MTSNHTRVHMTYRNNNLKLRLQQTSAGVAKEWFQCIDMKDVEVPSPGFWGISCTRAAAAPPGGRAAWHARRAH